MAGSASSDESGGSAAGCTHNYVLRSGAPLVSTLGARVCKRCGRLEVLFAITQRWVTLDEYDRALLEVETR